MVFLELLVDGCFLNLGEKCGFVIIKSEKTAISFHLEQKQKTFAHYCKWRGKKFGSFGSPNSGQKFCQFLPPPPPRYIHTFLLFLFILTTCCFYESGLENCGFGTSAVSRNYVQIQNFRFWD